MILIGNIFSLLGSICSLLSTRVKTYKKTLLIQSLDATCFTLSCIFLRGYSGIVVNSVAIIRNLSCAFLPLKAWMKWIFVALTMILGILFMDKSFYGILPIIASTFYSIVMVNTKDNLILKKSLLINNLLWFIYSIIILDFVGTGFKIISIISCIHFIIKSKKDKNSIE